MNFIKSIVSIFCIVSLISCKTEDPVLDDINVKINIFKSDFDNYISQYLIDSNLVIGHTSDIHAYRSEWKKNLIEFFNIFGQNNLVGKVDALLLTGDYCEGTSGRNKTNTLNEIKSVIEIAESQNTPCYSIIGNHDDNVEMNRGRIQYKGNNLISKQEQIDLIIGPLLKKWDTTEYLNTGYYKKDFLKKKIRMICLDHMDYPYDLDDNGYMKHNIGYMFSQKQLEWLYHALLTTPKDYGICIVMHAIPTKRALGEYAQGLTLIPDIVNAYKNKAKFNHIWTNPCMPEYSTKVCFDFTSIESSNFICYIGGHMHKREISTIEKYPDQIMITVPCLYYSQNHDDSCSFNIMSINQSKREIAICNYRIDKNIGNLQNNVIAFKY